MTMSNIDLDSLIEEASVVGNLTGGENPAWLAKHTNPRLVAALGGAYTPNGDTGVFWTPEEEQFVRDNHGWLSLAEIAQHLGRTVDAVQVRLKKKLRLPAITVTQPDDEWLGIGQAARLLGVLCPKQVTSWVERGLIVARPLPVARRILVIHRDHLIRFAVNPENWIYFETERVTEPHLRRLLRLRRERWGDEWWTAGQAAAYHGCSTTTINHAILTGQLPAKRWDNWQIKRSDVRGAVIRVGRNAQRMDISEAGDHFLLLCLAIGLSYVDTSCLCGWGQENTKRSEARWWYLRYKKLLPGVIERQPYGIQYDPDRAILWVDWRPHRHRFPKLVKAVSRFHQGAVNEQEARWVAGLLCSWAQWFAQDEEQRNLVRKLHYSSQIAQRKLQQNYQAILAWGIDPLKVE